MSGGPGPGGSGDPPGPGGSGSSGAREGNPDSGVQGSGSGSRRSSQLSHQPSLTRALDQLNQPVNLTRHIKGQWGSQR